MLPLLSSYSCFISRRKACLSALSWASISRTSFSCSLDRFFLPEDFKVLCYLPLSFAVYVVAFSIAAISGTIWTYRCHICIRCLTLFFYTRSTFSLCRWHLSLTQVRNSSSHSILSIFFTHYLPYLGISSRSGKYSCNALLSVIKLTRSAIYRPSICGQYAFFMASFFTYFFLPVIMSFIR